MSVEKYLKHLRLDRLPHVWCPGCGHGIVLKAAVGAIEELGLNPDKIAVVSGIGCSSRATGYLNFNTMHTLHGRAIAFATGVKLARPDMHVIVMTGDGDAGAIGGNHFIHAARRNMDITVIAFNNNIYGMTGGQYSPTTPEDCYATTSPYGNIEKPFDLSKIAIASGASYVARATTFNFLDLQKYIKNGLSNAGYSFVEAVTQCPTYFGRYNKIGTAPKMMEYLKSAALPISKAKKDMAAELKCDEVSVSRVFELKESIYSDRIITGEFVNQPRPGYVDKYEKVIQKAGAHSE